MSIRFAACRRMFGRLSGLALAISLGAAPAAAETVTVFAASSLKNAFDAIADGYAAETGGRVALVYAGTAALARQVEAGAPADVIVAASADWMDRLEAGGAIDPATRFDLAGNRLALIAPGAPDGRAAATIGPDFDLAGRLGGGFLAMALVEAVPAGVYGKAALEALGLWAAVAPRVAQADNVRAALALVALGEAALGVVYVTDAAAEPRTHVVGLFPESAHPPIVYPAAAVAGRAARAAGFLAHLRGPAARDELARQGFVPLAE